MKTDVNYNKVLLIHGGGICGRVVNTSNSRSGGLGFKPRPLHCILRQGTLLHFVSLHPGVSMGTSDILLGGNTGKNNGFPFSDILGYLKNTHKNPKFGKVRQAPTREFPTKFPDWDLSHSSKFGIFVGIL